jgi:hypothetical protein
MCRWLTVDPYPLIFDSHNHPIDHITCRDWVNRREQGYLILSQTLSKYLLHYYVIDRQMNRDAYIFLRGLWKSRSKLGPHDLPHRPRSVVRPAMAGSHPEYADSYIQKLHNNWRHWVWCRFSRGLVAFTDGCMLGCRHVWPWHISASTAIQHWRWRSPYE